MTPCLARLSILIYLKEKFFHSHLLPLLTLIILVLQIQKFQIILIFFSLRLAYYLVNWKCLIKVNLIKMNYIPMNSRTQYYFKLYCSSFCFPLTTYFMCKNIFNRLFCVIELNLVLIRSQYLKQIHFHF